MGAPLWSCCLPCRGGFARDFSAQGAGRRSRSGHKRGDTRDVSGRIALPIIDAAYRLALEINQAAVESACHQRPGLGRLMEEAGLGVLASLAKARCLKATDPAKAALLVQASQAPDAPRLPVRMSRDLEHLPFKPYEELARTMREVGGIMVGGW